MACPNETQITNNESHESTRAPSSKVNCSVHECKSARFKTGTLMYHNYPRPGHKVIIRYNTGDAKVYDRRTIWLNRLRRGEEASPYMQVCALHFRDEDYTCSGWSSRKTLLPTAIPSRNLPFGNMTPIEKDSDFGIKQKTKTHFKYLVDVREAKRKFVLREGTRKKRYQSTKYEVQPA